MRFASARLLLPALAAALMLSLASQGAIAAEQVFHMAIVNKAFQPDSITIPAGQRVKIMIKNEDAFPAEFESSEAHREVVIPGKTELPVYVGPLEPGTYHFFNDFHPDSKGTLIVLKKGS
jgi:plastocyanin